MLFLKHSEGLHPLHPPPPTHTATTTTHATLCDEPSSDLQLRTGFGVGTVVVNFLKTSCCSHDEREDQGQRLGEYWLALVKLDLFKPPTPPFPSSATTATSTGHCIPQRRRRPRAWASERCGRPPRRQPFRLEATSGPSTTTSHPVNSCRCIRRPGLRLMWIFHVNDLRMK